MDVLWLLGSALLVFVARVLDMSFDTMRIMATIRGQRWHAALYGFIAAAVFIVALSTVLRPPMHWLQMLGYASGFAGGSLAGTTIARRYASGYLLVRIISRKFSRQITARLRNEGYAVTRVHGEGRDGDVDILFSAMKRERGEHALEVIQQIDPAAFVLFDNVEHAVGGFIPRLGAAGISVRR